MPAMARAELESLLRARKLDRTLTTALPSPDSAPRQARGALRPSTCSGHPEPVDRSTVLTVDPELAEWVEGRLSKGADERWLARTGIPNLDERLGGGIPRGQLSEFVGLRSSGRMTVLLSTLAAATERGEMVALVDPLDMFDPESASACGVNLARLLWVRGEAPGAGRASLPREYGELHAAVDRALKAFNLVLQAGGFGLVALDLAEVAPPMVRRISFTTWLRLQRVVESSETACVVVGSEPMARSAAGLTVALQKGVNRVIGVSRVNGERPEEPHSPYLPQIVNARVVRARALETGRDVRLCLSPAVF